MIKKIVIIGGGAAGFFAANQLRDHGFGGEIDILERSNKVLSKVLISGGGRCNVTHACFEPKKLIEFYPRGSKELKSAFQTFNPTHTIQWFASKGVKLKTEADNRMFPQSNTSQTIVECLYSNAVKRGVNVRMGVGVHAIETSSNGWKIKTSSEDIACNAVLVCTGSSDQVWKMLTEIGVDIIPPVPSLFTFNIKDPRLKDLAGISIPNAIVSIKNSKIHSTTGPLLITHWGLSGPAVLKQSAWAARDLFDLQYIYDVQVNWLSLPYEDTLKHLQSLRDPWAKKIITATSPYEQIPQRLWKRLCLAAGIGELNRWAEVSKESVKKLAKELSEGIYQAKGKTTFKDEFVTCGGIDRNSIDFNTMQIKNHPLLFVAGEVIDIDGVTGGFNFQAAWTTGHIAAHGIIRAIS